MTGVLQVALEVPEPSSLLDRVYPNGKLGGLTVDGLVPGVLGQHVAVTVKVSRPAREFTFAGQLAWARHKGTGALVASYGVDFLPSDQAAWARLLAFARQELSPSATRLEPRVSVELPVRVLHQGEARRELLADLSTGGAFVRAWNPLPAGTWVELLVRPPRALRSLHLKGRVAWVRLAGTEPGMGVAFVDEDGTQAPQVRRLLERVAPR